MNQAVAPAVGVDACRVRLSAFQGPLDLLIHLVRTGAIDAADLSMTEIARQYDAYVTMMRCLDLEAAGESLVLVASLVHMKSRQLLPQPPAVETPGTEEGAPSDREVPALRGALRVAAEHLQEREAVMELIYHRADSTVADYAGQQGIEADLFALLSAFRSILRRVGTDPAARISRERITLVEKMAWLIDRLQRERRVGFRSLFSEVADRVGCILTFLALLEIIRLRLARAFTSHHQEDILIVIADEAPYTPSPAEAAIDA